MHNTLVAVNESTVSGLGRLARFFGFSEVMGRLYGTLLLSPEPLSLDDLGDTLEISKGSVSMNMRDLERWGIDEKRILVEDQSKNTRENARYSARIVHEHGFKNVLVVTSAFHMKRAAACFAAVDLPVDLMPVDFRAHERVFTLRSLLPEAEALAVSSGVVHELAGRLVYRIVGYGR